MESAEELLRKQRGRSFEEVDPKSPTFGRRVRIEVMVAFGEWDRAIECFSNTDNQEETSENNYEGHQRGELHIRWT